MASPDHRLRSGSSRQRVRLLRALKVFAAAVGVVWIAWLMWPLLLGGDERAIAFERYWRRTLYSFGFDLPGTPDLDRLNERLAAEGVALGAPVMIRIFKREFQLEMWLLRGGRFHHFATYPICRFSGGLGPKRVRGDRQAPEGFYSVAASQLNPNSRWHRSFDLGFPNAFDRSHGRSGSFLMVHGGCSSAGCYAMTNPQIDEIWTLVTAALKHGQKRFQVAVLPFRMTDDNLQSHASHPAIGFWRQLKNGYDLFEREHLPPRVAVCHGRYTFAPAGTLVDGSTVVASACPSPAEASEKRRPGSTNMSAR
jgi:murein L,D-transpeptidase YafK